MNLNDDYAGRCRDCDADIYEDDDYAVLPNGEWLCDLCYDERYFSCDECGEIYSIENLYQRGEGGSDLILCLDCLEKSYNVCINCLDPYPKEELRQGAMCEICLEMYDMEEDSDE